MAMTPSQAALGQAAHSEDTALGQAALGQTALGQDTLPTGQVTSDDHGHGLTVSPKSIPHHHRMDKGKQRANDRANDRAITSTSSSSSSPSPSAYFPHHTREYSTSSSSSSASPTTTATSRVARRRAGTWTTVDSVKEDDGEGEEEHDPITSLSDDEDQLVFQLSHEPWSSGHDGQALDASETVLATAAPTAVAPATTAPTAASLDDLPVEIKLAILRQLYHIAFDQSGKMARQSPSPSPSTRAGCQVEALRSVVRASQISRQWRAVALDGALWHSVGLDLSAPGLYDMLREWQREGGLLARVLAGAAGFLQEVNLRGMSNLSGRLLSNLTCRNLRAINLKGCVALPSMAIQRILREAPRLSSVNLSQIPAVDGETLGPLVSSRHLTALDLSFCSGLVKGGFTDSLTLFLARTHARSSLASLRLASLTHAVNDGTLAQLGKFPNLVDLDISASTVTDRGFLAWVAPAFQDEDAASFEYVQITPRQAGYSARSPLPSQEFLYREDARDDERVVRKVLPLRRLTANNCKLLGEHCMSYLAHSVPHLQALSLASSGLRFSRRDRGQFADEPEAVRGHIQDQSLARLLESLWEDDRYSLLSTAPLRFARSRKAPHTQPRGLIYIDLDDLCNLSDNVISGLLPPSAYLQVPGSRLVHASLNNLHRLTTDAVQDLIEKSPRLLTLNLDLTTVNASVLQGFLQALQKRPADCRFAGISTHDCRNIMATDIRETARFTRPAFAEPGPGWPRNVGAGEREEERLAEPRIGSDGRMIRTRGELVDDLLARMCADPNRPVIRHFWGWQYIRNGIIKGTIGLEAVVGLETELAKSSGLLPDLLSVDFAKQAGGVGGGASGMNAQTERFNRGRLASLLSHLRATIGTSPNEEESRERESESSEREPAPAPPLAPTLAQGPAAAVSPSPERSRRASRSRANSSASVFGSLVASGLLSPRDRASSVTAIEPAREVMQAPTANGSSTSITSTRSVRSVGSLFTRRRQRRRDDEGRASPPFRARLVFRTSSSLSLAAEGEGLPSETSPPTSPRRFRFGGRQRSASNASSSSAGDGPSDLSQIQFDPLRPGRLRSSSLGTGGGTGGGPSSSGSALRQSTTIAAMARTGTLETHDEASTGNGALVIRLDRSSAPAGAAALPASAPAVAEPTFNSRRVRPVEREREEREEPSCLVM